MRRSARSLIPFALAVVLVVAGWWFMSGRRPMPNLAGPPPKSAATSTEPAAKLLKNKPEGKIVDDARALERRLMVEQQLRGRDITEERVLAAMLKVPRHAFVPERYQDEAYDDAPLPIGHGQTISQPYIVALMTQLVRPAPRARALDVGTGSGYQAAILAELVQEVYGVEIVCPLADEARERLDALGYKNVTIRCGDGYQGWQEHAPFDVIIVAAAPNHVPQPLVDQLASGGRMVIPVGDFYQELRLIEKDADGNIRETNVAPVSFVPMTGRARGQREP